MICHHCKKEHEDLTPVYHREGKYYFCSECFFYYDCYYCTHCDRYWVGGTETDVTSYRGDELACPDCIEDMHTVYCDDCERLCEEDFIIVIYREGTPYAVCRDCIDENYYYCLACDNYVHANDYAGNDLCVDCHHERYGTAEILSYWTKPSPLFYGDGPLYFGIELEIDDPRCENDRLSGAKIVHDFLGQYAYCKDDGSLTNGFEIVTHPSSYEYHYSRRSDWESLFSSLAADGWKSHDAGTCGLHIHISRDAFGDDENERTYNIAKFLFLVEKHYNKMLRFSRRTASDMERWAERYGLEPHDTPASLIEKAKGKDRYHIVNFSNRQTVEIRAFRGTLNAETFFATLQLVKVLFRVATEREGAFKSICEVEWTYICKMAELSNYEELVSYLKRRDLYETA